MIRSYTFFIEEHDKQVGSRKYYKMQKHGRDASHAYSRALRYVATAFSGRRWLDYDHRLLTLNEYNKNVRA